MNHVFLQLSFVLRKRNNIILKMGWFQRFYHLSGLHHKRNAIELFGLIDYDEAEALRKVNNPRCATKLHYDVVGNITRHYPHVLITPGLGENQITHFGRFDSKAKGYRKGHPGLELKCKDGCRNQENH